MPSGDRYKQMDFSRLGRQLETKTAKAGNPEFPCQVWFARHRSGGHGTLIGVGDLLFGLGKRDHLLGAAAHHGGYRVAQRRPASLHE